MTIRRSIKHDNRLCWGQTLETVRFNEIDQWGIAWHGHYFAWFEAGRMELMNRFGLSPGQLVELGFIAPIISLTCEYIHPAGCGDQILIRTTAIKPEIAALIFKSEIRRNHDNLLLACCEATQVVMTKDRKMIYHLKGELQRRVEKLLAFCCG
ncbi:MAG: acyl-CoA thioesterase [Desulfobacteraceae bacterium]|nr:acyl-CoA thioesterase [Desulfobacteraceae bacterium]